MVLRTLATVVRPVPGRHVSAEMQPGQRREHRRQHDGQANQCRQPPRCMGVVVIGRSSPTLSGSPPRGVVQ
jgi:hypothetical protein